MIGGTSILLGHNRTRCTGGDSGPLLPGHKIISQSTGGNATLILHRTDNNSQSTGGDVGTPVLPRHTAITGYWGWL